MENFININNNHHKDSVNNTLKRRFNQLSLDYLRWEIKFLFFDYQHLEDNNHVKNIGFEDYSFFVAPAYKAFEGFMLQLGVDMGLFEEDNLPNNATSFFDEDKIEKIIKDLLQGVINLTKSADKEKFKDITGRISEVKNLLKRYRHTPAHFQGNQCIPNFEKAKDYATSIIFNTNDLIKLLFETGILTKDKNRGIL